MGKKEKVKKDETGEPTIYEGVFMFPNGDKYEGEYIQTDGGHKERTGQGKHFSKDGTLYEGHWAKDKMNGKGKLTFPHKATYEGEFVDNEFHGVGRYTWPNGCFYDGQFQNNKLQGEGEFTDTENQVWEGSFQYKAALGLRFQLKM